MVTPRLVKPLPANYPLPTDGHTDPTRSELFLGGRMEGKPDSGGKARSTDGAAGFELK